MLELLKQHGKRLVTATVLSCICWASATFAGPAVTLNLKDADVSTLIATVADITGKNFIIDPRVSGKVTVISKHPMDSDEIYRVFLSILEVHGFSAIHSGNVIKIIPDVKAKQSGMPVGAPRDPNSADEIETRVIQVNNVAAAQLVPILRPLVPQEGHLAAYVPTNVLIVSDRSSNIQRILSIIRRIDLASDDQVEVVRLQHASANEVVRIIDSLQGKAGEPNQPQANRPKYVADDRTNSILLGGDTASRLKIRALVAHLDTPMDNDGDTQVIYLRYAKAKDLVPVLEGVSQNIVKAQAGTDAKAASTKSSAISINADESTNALVVSAPPEIMRSIKTVIQQLDIRRAQVLIETIIAEISEKNTQEQGIEFAGAPLDNQDSPVFGSGNSGALNSVLGALATKSAPSLASGLTVGVGRLVSEGLSFAALLRLMATDSSVNLLSTPNIVTMDNQEAEIVIAQNVPFVTGQYTNTGSGDGATNPFQTVERKDVGLILKVKPQINEGNAIQMDIEQEISKVTNADVANLTTRKRSIKTTVIVEDGSIIVLGGLLEDEANSASSKVPYLGDIPVAGALFRSDTADSTKTNLTVFMQPKIMRDAATTSNFTNRKYSAIRAKQLKAREEGLRALPFEKTAVLPEDNDGKRIELPDPFAEDE